MSTQTQTAKDHSNNVKQTQRQNNYNFYSSSSDIALTIYPKLATSTKEPEPLKNYVDMDNKIGNHDIQSYKASMLELAKTL